MPIKEKKADITRSVYKKTRSNMLRRLLSKTIHSIRTQGLQATHSIIMRKVKLHAAVGKMAAEVLPDENVLQEQRNMHFEEMPRISILTPLFNTPEKFLTEMMDSVLAQTYPNWELCLCDASDASHDGVERICREYAEKEQRIHYRRLTKNEGISGNTNECIRLASGEYFALLDHDDLLHPSALFEAARVILEEKADFVFTDETKFHNTIQDFFDPAFKPDYAKDDLRAHNYICHLTVYSRKLLEIVGPYDKSKDGSQDHDMVLRLTEKANKIVHIPKILYFWRAHAGSVATGTEVKSYATQAGINAVKDQLERENEPGTVHTIFPYPSLYRVEYALTGIPLISIVIYGDASFKELRRCIASIEKLSPKDAVEVLILQDHRSDKELETLSNRFPAGRFYILRQEGQKQRTSALNEAVQASHGEVLFFLHAKTELMTENWIEELLMYVQRKDVGAAGLKLYDGHGKIYSGGIVLDQEKRSALHHMYRGLPENDPGYEAGLRHVRNVSILAGTGFMISKSVFDSAGGFREEMGGYRFADLCLRLREMGLLNVWNPFATAIHRGTDPLLEAGGDSFICTWNQHLKAGDPYYNSNSRKLQIF